MWDKIKLHEWHYLYEIRTPILHLVIEDMVTLSRICLNDTDILEIKRLSVFVHSHITTFNGANRRATYSNIHDDRGSLANEYILTLGTFHLCRKANIVAHTYQY